VDEKGQQLPYIDQIELSLVENNDAIAAKALGCEIDMQFRNMDLRKFRCSRKRAEVQLPRLPLGNGECTNLALWPNQSYADDPVLRDIFPEQGFPLALSHAIDRRDQRDRVPGSGRDPFGDGGARFRLLRAGSREHLHGYDPKKAAEYLDKAG